MGGQTYEYRPNGTRWKFIRLHGFAKHKPYDYANEGLLNKLLPEHVYNAKNTTTRAVFNFVEDICVRLLQYVDDLRHFKDWNWRQY